MDVDGGSGAVGGPSCSSAELQQVVCSIKEVLGQLQQQQQKDKEEEEGMGVQQDNRLQEQLVQLQQRAALLCK